MTTKQLTPLDVLKREQAKALREALEMRLARDLKEHGIEFEREFMFWPGRKWRFDFALKPAFGAKAKLAIEVQGGIYSGGRHTRGAALEGEYEKLAYAIMAGWYVMPVTGKQIKSGIAIQWICKASGIA